MDPFKCGPLFFLFIGKCGVGLAGRPKKGGFISICSGVEAG